MCVEQQMRPFFNAHFLVQRASDWKEKSRPKTRSSVSHWKLSLSLALAVSVPAYAQDQPKIEVVPQLPHSQNIRALAFSHDGTNVLSGGSTAKLWDVASGRLIRTFESGVRKSAVLRSFGAFFNDAGPRRTGFEIRTFAFSPDGTHVLLPGEESMVIREMQTGRLVRRVEISKGAISVAYSPDGNHILSADRTGIKLWDVASGQPIRNIREPWFDAQRGDSVAFSADGMRAAYSNRRKAKIWNIETGQVIRAFEDLEYQIDCLALSPDGAFVIFGGAGQFELREIETGNSIRNFDVVGFAVSVAFLPDGGRVLTSGNEAELWDVATGVKIRAFGRTNGLAPVVLSRDGTKVLTTSLENFSVKLWSTDTGQLIRIFQGHSQPIQTVAFSHDGDHILNGEWSHDGIMRLWDASTGQLVRPFPSLQAAVVASAFSPDGKRVLSADTRDHIKLWDLGTGELIRTFDHESRTNMVAFSHDGKSLLSAGDKSVRLWNLTSGRMTSFTRNKEEYISYISTALSNDGLVFAASSKGIVDVWDSVSGGLIRTLDKLHLAPNTLNLLLSAAFAPDGSSVIFGSGVGMPPLSGEVHSLRIGDTVTNHKPVGFGDTSKEPVNSLAFSSDGTQVLAGGDVSAKLWNFDTGQLIRIFEGHTNSINSIAISPNGARTLSGSSDTTTRIWDSATGQELVRMTASSDGAWLTMTPAGFFVGSSRNTNLLHVVRGLETYSIAQFADHLYRPDLVAQRLNGDPERQYKNAAFKLNLETILNSGDAPQIELIPDKVTEIIGDSIRTTVRIVDTGGGIGEKVIWRVNGITKEISLKSKVQEESSYWVVTETLRVNPAKKNVIEVTAYNGAGLLATEPFRIEVDKFGTSVAPRPKMYVLALGVSDYVNDDWDLKYAMTDARSIANHLKSAAKGLYENVLVTVLPNDKVTRAGIDMAFEALRDQVQPTDVFVLFVAGHGRNVAGTYYFLPQDLTFEGGKSVEDGIGQETWQAWLKLIAAEKSILIFDTCESSAAAELTRGERERETAIDRLRHATGRSIITAARQAAYEGYKGHGVLTWTILDALTGEKPDEVDLYELAAHVDQEVPLITKSLFGIRQRPHSKIEGNFPIGVRIALAPSNGFVTDSEIPHAPTHALLWSERIRQKPQANAAGERQLGRGGRVRVVKLVDKDWALVARAGQIMGYLPMDALLPLE